jgi:hypothetical protein
MKKTLQLILVAAVISGTAGAADKVSSSVSGVHRPGEKAYLASTFVNSVNRYLRRYEPRLIEKKADYVKMMADYDFDYAIELKMDAEGYDIVVTLEEKTSKLDKARKQAAHLATGVFTTLERDLASTSRSRSAAN